MAAYECAFKSGAIGPRRPAPATRRRASARAGGLDVRPAARGCWARPSRARAARSRASASIASVVFDRHADFGGIRIEDDILVTADGRRELGPHIARNRADVEAACAA